MHCKSSVIKTWGNPSDSPRLVIGRSRLGRIVKSPSAAPNLFEFCIARRVRGLESKVSWYGIANATFVCAFKTFNDGFALAGRKTESHFVILGLADDSISIAGENDLGLSGLNRLDHTVGAIDASGKARLDPPPRLVEGSHHQHHDLRRITIDKDDLRLEISPGKRGTDDGLIFLPGELRD